MSLTSWLKGCNCNLLLFSSKGGSRSTWLASLVTSARSKPGNHLKPAQRLLVAFLPSRVSPFRDLLIFLGDFSKHSPSLLRRALVILDSRLQRSAVKFFLRGTCLVRLWWSMIRMSPSSYSSPQHRPLAATLTRTVRVSPPKWESVLHCVHSWPLEFRIMSLCQFQGPLFLSSSTFMSFA